jgi:hypothetical protein
LEPSPDLKKTIRPNNKTGHPKGQPVLKRREIFRWVSFIINNGFTAFAAIANYPALNINLASEHDLNMTPVLSNGNPPNPNRALTISPA